MTGQDSEEHDPAPAGLATRSLRGKDCETRLPPLIAVAIAVVLYAALPESLLVGPRFLIPAIEVLLVVALTVTNPWRLTRQTRWSRTTSLGLAGLVVLSNLVTLAMLVHILITETDTKGSSLLVAALQVWLTNVIAFTLIFWELDRAAPWPALRPSGTSCRSRISASPRTRPRTP